jgi:hypothetical protein
MSKKKGKAKAKKAPKGKAKRNKATAASGGATRTSGASTSHTSQVTSFVFRTGSGNKIRTAPQRAYAGPGSIEWTVVNLVDGSDIPATLSWPGPEGGPWGKEPIEIRGGKVNKAIPAGVAGTFKYVVRALDAQEDPEIEIPGN